MKLRGAGFLVKALEDEGVRFVFGIPGTHNMELYDMLEESSVEPVLVTDEQSASFLADAVSRTTDAVGVVNLIPGAGTTQALSGIAEAYMDNVPLVVIASGVRSDIPMSYQLHDIDQLAVLAPITKERLRAEGVKDIYRLVRRAFAVARSGTPGPVAVEIPANCLAFSEDVSDFSFEPVPGGPSVADDDLKKAADMINAAALPMLYLGNGALRAQGDLRLLAETMYSPVATTVEGKGILPEDHPLWLWCGLGASVPGSLRKIQKRADCILAIGCRFGEIATASYGFSPPETLIHVDINNDVFNRNYKAALAIEADAGEFISKIMPLLKRRNRNEKLESEIREAHAGVDRARAKQRSADKVSPAALFAALQKFAAPDAIYTADSGNGMYLAMEHLRLTRPRCFIAPVDFQCMGFAGPAAIGAKLANPDRDVIALEGDGALLMTGLELLTASNRNIAPIICVLRDGELGQISQFQRATFNRCVCTTLANYALKDFAQLTGCEFVSIFNDAELEAKIEEAFTITRSRRPVILEVRIDYSHKTYFTNGIIATNFLRFPWKERIRLATRLVGRKVLR